MKANFYLRLVPALFGALLISVAVFLFMQSLIRYGAREDVQLPVYSDVQVFRPEPRESEPETAEDMVEPPREEPSLQPMAMMMQPSAPEPAANLDFPALDIGVGNIDIGPVGSGWSAPLSPDVVTVAKGGQDARGFVEVVPFNTRRPNVPEVAWQNKISGWVLVAFSVTPQGKTRNVRVLDANPRGVFEEKVVSAVEDWSYRVSFSGKITGDVVLTQKVEVQWQNFPRIYPMSIERMGHKRFFLIFVTLCCLLAGSRSFAEEGQYRSKILLTPVGEIGKGAELSIEELEQQIGSMEQPYAKSSAGRHLARHYVEQGDYDKAIAYYQEALLAEGLSDVSNREMLRELARVYLLKKDYAAAVQALEQVLAIDLLPEATDYLLAAQANYRLGKYVAVVAALDNIEEHGLALDVAQMRQALALYYQAGAYAQCERLLRRLLQAEPNEPRHWHLLASVYLQQDKKRQALDQLALARRKGVSFGAQDVLLLADLYAVNDSPYDAAETLAAALAAGEIKANGPNYRKLFEFWFQAREAGRAREALARAARLSGDTQLYLYLAQLQMDERDWQPMHQTMLSACAQQLPDRFVGRANLLLGISQLKLGDASGARRSFINATLIGGVNAQAGQWLDFMGAEPATEDEVRRIVGICYGASDKRLKVAAADSWDSNNADSALQQDAAAAGELLQIKTVPPVHLFYAQYQESFEDLMGTIRPKLMRMNISLVKAGGSVQGPVHIIFSGGLRAPSDEASWKVGLPTSGAVSGKGRFRSDSQGEFKCAYMNFAGEPEELQFAVQRFAAMLEASEYTATGEGRLLLLQGSDASKLNIELQAGIQ